MRKLSALVIALIAMLVVGGITANAAKKKVVAKSKVTLQFSSGPNSGPPPYYEEAVFKGKVKATKVKIKGYRGNAKKKAKKTCRKKRQVTIKQVGGGTYGTTTTNAQGKYVLSATDAYNQPGRYLAKVARKRKGKVTCKAAKSPPVEAF